MYNLSETIWQLLLSIKNEIKCSGKVQYANVSNFHELIKNNKRPIDEIIVYQQFSSFLVLQLDERSRAVLFHSFFPMTSVTDLSLNSFMAKLTVFAFSTEAEIVLNQISFWLKLATQIVNANSHYMIVRYCREVIENICSLSQSEEKNIFYDLIKLSPKYANSLSSAIFQFSNEYHFKKYSSPLNLPLRFLQEISLIIDRCTESSSDCTVMKHWLNVSWKSLINVRINMLGRSASLIQDDNVDSKMKQCQSKCTVMDYLTSYLIIQLGDMSEEKDPLNEEFHVILYKLFYALLRIIHLSGKSNLSTKEVSELPVKFFLNVPENFERLLNYLVENVSFKQSHWRYFAEVFQLAYSNNCLSYSNKSNLQSVISLASEQEYIQLILRNF